MTEKLLEVALVVITPLLEVFPNYLNISFLNIILHTYFPTAIIINLMVFHMKFWACISLVIQRLI